jgi:hypothetical protein
MSVIISEKNKIRESIRLLYKNIEHSSDTIKRFKSQPSSEFILTQLEKLKNSKIGDENEIVILEKRLVDLESGLLTEELFLQNKQNKEIADSKSNTNKKKKDEETKLQVEKTKKSREFDSNNRSYARGEKQKDYDMNRAYKYYEKTVANMPEYMIENLKNMPNNKGYIWRDIHCYGDLPIEKNQPITMFEKQRDVLIIHEWTNKYYTIYHKVGKNGKKSIVSRKEINKTKFSSDSLSDFMIK